MGVKVKFQLIPECGSRSTLVSVDVFLCDYSFHSTNTQMQGLVKTLVIWLILNSNVHNVDALDPKVYEPGDIVCVSMFPVV